jgi:hypothetical protein
MATITQIRGALLEEAVLFLLKKVGYETHDARTLAASPIDGMRAGHSGLEVRGRGTWHQLDAFALWKHSPAFMYPLQLIVEAKCYSSHRPVGVEVPRNAVGVLKDISENYFTFTRRGQSFQAPRYNYAAAIFSTSGFTQGAVEYAIAHQVFLIQYESVPAIQPLIDAIFRFNEDCISVRGKHAIAAARRYFRASLSGEEYNMEIDDPLTEQGLALLNGSIAQSCRTIEGSYFGMLQGRWPMHLLRRNPLPSSAFLSDSIRCRVIGNEHGEWKFVPVEAHPNGGDSFELEFSLPSVIAELVAGSWEDPVAVANIKQQYFSYIDLSGVIGGIRRNVRLELDRDWIRNYIRRRAET